jgi:hypothetical protein
MQSALGGSKGSPNDYDNDLLMNRIQGGKLLHIGLTDREKIDLTNARADLKAYVYADQYRNLKDICSAAILSSYIPIGTGPANWERESKNLAVRRAWDTVKEMRDLGFIKDGITKKRIGTRSGGGEVGRQEDSETNIHDKLGYLDGGLSNMFPEIDEATLIVSPVNGMYKKPYIAPMGPPLDIVSPMEQFKLPLPTHIEISARVKIGANIQNLLAFYQMARSSSQQVLEEKFREGYDDTKRFLSEHDLLSVFSVQMSC